MFVQQVGALVLLIMMLDVVQFCRLFSGSLLRQHSVNELLCIVGQFFGYGTPRTSAYSCGAWQLRAGLRNHRDGQLGYTEFSAGDNEFLRGHFNWENGTANVGQSIMKRRRVCGRFALPAI